MRILLIKPNSSAEFTQVVPPLGLMYLSAFLKNAGYKNVSILHMDAKSLKRDDLIKMLPELKPDVVGFSALTSESNSMHSLAKEIKGFSPEIITIAGGPYPTAYAADCLDNSAIDIVVRGEGEITLLETIRALENKIPFKDLLGISYKDNGAIIHNGSRDFIQDLDMLPLPDWDSIDIESYKYFVPQSPLMYRRKYMTIFTSRGCPFHCAYCHNILGKTFRCHSAERVFKEISILYERYGIRHIAIIDDIFNWDRKRSIDIMRMLSESGMKLVIHFSNGIKGDLLDEEQIQVFAKAGLSYTSVAIETGSPRMQKVIKKGVNFEKIKDRIALLVKYKIFVNGYFIIGLPGETFKEVIMTIMFACRSKLHTASFFVYHGYKGTELGDSLPDDLIKKVQNSTSIYTSASNFVNCSSMPKSLLVILRQLANILFYFNPFRIYRILKDLPDYSSFWILVKNVAYRTIFLK
jgi:radical SAM superfamily enzyme YgiQ (UPF0313 family)